MGLERKRRVNRGATLVFGHFSALMVTISHGCRGCRASETSASSPKDP